MNLTLPTVSIVIPVYNGERFLRPTIESVIRQDYGKLEIIVCDDGSTDSTPLIVKEFLDPRIRYIYQSNSGVSAARNLGISVSTGAYIIFLDSDDLIPPDYVSKRVAYSYSFNFDCLTGPVSPFGTKVYANSIMRGCSSDGVKEILLMNHEVATTPSAYFFSHHFIKEYSLAFDENLSSPADRDFILRCLKHGRFVYEPYLPEVLYRISPHSMSNSRNLSLVLDLEKFFLKLPFLFCYLGLENAPLAKISRAQHALHISSFSLSIGYYKLFVRYLSLSLWLNPELFVSKLLSFIRRRLTM